MNSDSQNFYSSPSNKNSASSEIESVDELINLLLEQKTSEDDFPDKILVENAEPTFEVQNQQPTLEDLDPEDLVFEETVKEIGIEIEGESQPMIAEEVKDRAFLPPTIETTTSSAENLDLIAQVAAIDTEQASSEELADAVNTLMPLMIELLKFKIDDSQQGVIETVRPVIDRLIEYRIQEDSPKMAAAIAKILPSAISERINLNPETIAKAIAPEIALAIREQIRLDKEAIPQVLGSEMGKAIKAQIELEQDAMVDALYPVIGSTISKYMVEVVQDINSKVESTLSLEGIKRKFRARMQGVSEAELIFQESVGYHVQAIFLIDKDSGIVIQEIQLPGERHLDSDMLAGMLTAIRSFANDCIRSDSELDSIDYGDWQIPLEAAGYCYLAVVVAGEPPKQFITKIRQVLGEIVLEYDEVIQNFDGNTAKVPQGIRTKLEQLTEVNKDKTLHKSSFLFGLINLLVLILGMILIPWGIVNYRTRNAHNIEQIAVSQLDAAPELSVYRLDPQVKQGKLVIQGRVPSEYLRTQAATITQGIASQHNLQLDNQILTVDIPVNPSLITGEIERLTNLFNQQPRVAIKTDYQPQTLKIAGFIGDESTYRAIAEAFDQIPGIDTIVFDVEEQLPVISQRIYFALDSNNLDFADNINNIKAVQKLLQQYPQLSLKLTGHSDGIGSSTINQRLGKERCQAVKTALVARGIEPNRLVVDCDSLLLPKNTDNDHTAWSKRYVSFEPFVSPDQP